MDWDDLRFALALHHQRTLSAAAKALGVNHTTVARRVDALQQDLGARLFDKTPTGFVATQAGLDILEVATRMEDQVLELDRLVLGRDARLSGSLRVTTFDAFATEHSDVFQSFCARYPTITLETIVSNTPYSLTKREADIAIRVVFTSPPENLVGKKLGRLEFAAFAARSLVESRSDPDDLASYPWMAWDERLNAKLTEDWLRKNVPNSPIVMRIDSAVINISFLCAGVGAAFAPCLWGDAHKELVRLREPEPDFGMDLWLLTHPDLRHTARIRAFVDHVDSAMAPLKARMAGAER